MNNRTKIRKPARETEIVKSLLHNSFKKRAIVRRRTTLKPLLTVENIMEQMKFTLAFIRRIPNKTRLLFDNMQNMVHIDKKWFFLKKDS